MKRRDQVTAGNYEVCGMFEPVYMMDRYVGDQPINTLFEHRPEAAPSRIVHAAHSPGSTMYYFSLESIDWDALPGSYRKTYELWIDRSNPAVKMNVYSDLISNAFNREHEEEWTKFQIDSGLHVPHDQEVDEFLLIFDSFVHNSFRRV